jgi:SAM-dependent methyltransferase
MFQLIRMTPAGRLLRRVRWALQPAAPDVSGRLSVRLAPPVMETDTSTNWILRIENHSRTVWPRSAAVRHCWMTRMGQPFGEAVATSLPRTLLPGDVVDLSIPVRGPSAVGDFTLRWELTSANAPGRIEESLPIHVTFPRSSDIDYHHVYRTADLNANSWWVVGAYHSREEYEKSSRTRRSMLEDCGMTPDSRILDVGCGTGQMAMALEDYLSDRGAYYGTDIGREAIEYCRRSNRRPNFVFEVGGMTRLPFPTSAGPFDLAIFFSVFTHTFTDETALLLAETARLLGPKGAIVADVITSDLVERGAGHRGQMWVNRGHFDQLAEATGFRCELLGRFPWGPHAERHMLRLNRR